LISNVLKICQFLNCYIVPTTPACPAYRQAGGRQGRADTAADLSALGGPFSISIIPKKTAKIKLPLDCSGGSLDFDLTS